MPASSAAATMPASTATGGASALRLVRPKGAHEQLEPCEEGLRALEQLEGPVRVCSLVGRQRDGKSTLLNCLFDRDTRGGFRTGHEMNPETTGLWARVRKHPRDEAWVVLVDSEGLESPHVPQFYNWCLSALTLLVSDVFMYQSKGNIDARNVDRLDVILRVAEQLLGGAQGRSGEAARRRDRASFIWVLRDHHLNMKLAPKEEMVDKLTETAHRALARCFAADFDCFPLPVPAASSQQLSRLDQMPLEEFDELFRQEVALLERKVYAALARPKETEVSGPELAALIRTYCGAIDRRAGALEDIGALPTQAQMLVKLAAQRAISAGCARYDEDMERGLPQDADAAALGRQHDVALAAALSRFWDTALGDRGDPDNVEAEHTLLERIAKWEPQLALHAVDDEKLKLGRSEVLAGGKLLEHFGALRDRLAAARVQLVEKAEATLQDGNPAIDDVDAHRKVLERLGALFAKESAPASRELKAARDSLLSRARSNLRRAEAAQAASAQTEALEAHQRDAHAPLEARLAALEDTAAELQQSLERQREEAAARLVQAEEDHLARTAEAQASLDQALQDCASRLDTEVSRVSSAAEQGLATLRDAIAESRQVDQEAASNAQAKLDAQLAGAVSEQEAALAQAVASLETGLAACKTELLAAAQQRAAEIDARLDGLAVDLQTVSADAGAALQAAEARWQEAWQTRSARWEDRLAASEEAAAERARQAAEKVAADVAAAREDAAVAVATLREEVSADRLRVQARLDELEARVEAASRDAASTQRELAEVASSTTRSVEELRADIREAKGATAEAVAALRESLATQAKAAVPHAQHSELTDRVERLAAATSELRQRVSSTEARADELAAPFEGQLEALQQALTKKEKELAGLWDAISHVSCNVTEIHDRLDMR